MPFILTAADVYSDHLFPTSADMYLVLKSHLEETWNISQAEEPQGKLPNGSCPPEKNGQNHVRCSLDVQFLNFSLTASALDR